MELKKSRCKPQLSADSEKVLYAIQKSLSSIQGRITVSSSLDNVTDSHLDTQKESIKCYKTTHSCCDRSHRTQSLSYDPSILMGGLSRSESVHDLENVLSRLHIQPLATKSPLAGTSSIPRQLFSPVILSISHMSQYMPCDGIGSEQAPTNRYDLDSTIEREGISALGRDLCSVCLVRW
ncbi:hypothetical protein C8R48DRAFT_671732 [Suillus tomentosus]|nr:hypothetical protein C8R48DRAFT_671732 [Suillus tomentosus]